MTNNPKLNFESPMLSPTTEFSKRFQLTCSYAVPFQIWLYVIHLFNYIYVLVDVSANPKTISSIKPKKVA